MAAVAAANESDLQAAVAGLQPALTPAAAVADARPLDPRLLMAACSGDRWALKNLLQLKDDDDQQLQGTRPDDGGSGAPTIAAAATTTTTTSVVAAPSISPPHVTVEVEPWRHDAVAALLPPPPAPPVPVLDEDGVTSGGEPTPPHDENAAALPARQTLAAAPAGHSAVPVVLDVDGVTMEGDSLLHVVAACGDIDCAMMIVGDKKRKGGADAVRLALEARNNKGDTPLHCAAGAGYVNMIACLAALITTTTDDDNEEARAAVQKAFLRMQNDCGETALHQAIRAAASNKLRFREAEDIWLRELAERACIDKLMGVDPELACIPHEDGASPLYLAISLGEIEIAKHLYDKSNGKLSYSGPDGRNVLHAAVSRASVETVILLLQMLTSADAASVETQTPPGRLLLSQLASQRDKENGSTPLHLAASLYGLPSPWLRFPHQVRPLVGSDGARLGGRRYCEILPLMLSLVLDANKAMAYQPDKAGLYPIHVAAGSGSRDAVEMLLERCPDCATLRDAKGRTFLHVAAEEGRYMVVEYVCEQSQKCGHSARLLSSILNAQDIDGDTPLHRAVYAGELRVVCPLIWNQQVRLDVPNKVGMRPIDVSWTTMPLEAYYAWDPRLIIRMTLLKVEAPYGENNRGDLFRKKRILSKEEDKEMSQNVTATAQVLALFSVLITTVTFASAFTLPGGYRSAGDGGGGVAGTPVLAGPKSYAFDAFILSDTLAFLCSLLATSILLYAGVPYGTVTNRFMLINYAYTLLWHAARSLVAAFALGLYVVLLPVARTIAIAIGVLIIMSVCNYIKGSEGIDDANLMERSLRKRSRWGFVSACILGLLDRFSTYVIIFGLPAIRWWARLP